MKKEIICTVCPRGCHIQAEGENEKLISAEGYSCKRGLEYAETEFFHPVRILTTTVKIKGTADGLLPVRSERPVPKEKLFACMDVIRSVQVAGPVARYDVVVADICGTGINIVATGTVE